MTESGLPGFQRPAEYRSKQLREVLDELAAIEVRVGMLQGYLASYVRELATLQSDIAGAMGREVRLL